MAGSVQFNIAVLIEGAEVFPELAGRTSDLRPAFDMIIRKWAKGNADKFRKGEGMGMTGVQDDPSVYWQALSDQYWRSKQKAGFPDNLMERTGDLRNALTDPSGFFQAMTASDAVFGTPNSPEDEMKIVYNSRTRQTVFLSNDDSRMIEATIKHYFELGEDFEQILFAKGLARKAMKTQMASMDIAFDDTVGH